jgi:hypothetical protein
MKKVFLPIFLFMTAVSHAQDLTGTWEGEFVRGTVGLRQPSRMVLEIVQVEGRLYGIFDLYPVDTQTGDKPNITYTVEGNCKPNTVRFSLIQGRVVNHRGRSGPGFVQFIFERLQKDSADVLAGKWLRQIEPINTSERGAGTFSVKRVTKEVSDRLEQPRREKYILEKINPTSFIYPTFPGNALPF